MPKIIREVREMAIKEAKQQLIEKGPEALTMRSVASACGIAVGTLYNYFPSKDILIASAMLEDWKLALSQMHIGCTRAGSLSEGLRCIYDSIRSFSAMYSPSWQQYRSDFSGAAFILERHRQLIAQLNEILTSLLKTQGLPVREIFSRSALELLLQQAARETQGNFDEILPVLEKLLI